MTFSCKRWSPDAFRTIATLKGSGGGKSFMLNGHIDIDPLAMGWRRDPWSPSVEDDRIYGGGIRNMKGGLASMITAAEALRTSGIERRGDIVLACVVGELQGGVGTLYLCEHGPLADMAVVPEPSRRGQHLDDTRGRVGDGDPRHWQLTAHSSQG